MFLLYRDLCSSIHINDKFNVYKFFHYIYCINNIKHLFESSIYYDQYIYYDYIKKIFKKNIFEILIYDIYYMFSIAAKYGHYEVIKNIILINIINNVHKHYLINDIYEHAIRLSSRKGHYKILKYLLKKVTPKINPNSHNNYSIRWASRKGHYKIVKLLLKDKQIDPSADNNCAIKWAYQTKRDKIIKILLKDKRVKRNFLGKSFSKK